MAWTLTGLEPAKTFLERALRRRRDTHAWIRQKGSFATQQCRVVDISGTGVHLRVVDARIIPDKFILLFSKSGPGYHASVIWRRGTELGAEFFSGNPPPRHV
jgi:hypothetical protein